MPQPTTQVARSRDEIRMSHAPHIPSAAFAPELARELTPIEEYVIWACLWANVRDVHQPVYNMDAAQWETGDALLAELDARFRSGAVLSECEREIAYALGHGVGEADAGCYGDGALAEQLCDFYTALIDAKHAS
jgi:hypothetical protein